MTAVHIGVVGDIHRHWGEEDVAFFQNARYDLVLFVGDLGGYAQRGALQVARSIARLTVPALVVPGNHDSANLGQLLGEVVGSSALVQGFAPGHGRRRDRLERALGAVPMAGYSSHGVGDLTLIAARPHSMGGPSLGFRPLLQRRFGVGSLDASAARLRSLVDAAPTDRLVFVGHNGPAGLGDRRDAIWGCDFRAEEGDFGDPDLADAVAHARRQGKQVLAVLAGHMHRRLRGGGERTWTVEDGGVRYVNAAVVPRVQARGRHHVRVTIQGTEVAAEDVWV